MIDTPVIYLTRYYKEKSSLYFTLYHELIHIKKDFNILKNIEYISIELVNSSSFSLEFNKPI